MQFEQDPVMARAQARVGSTLRDKWTLDRLLGVGGMAAVYAATHRNGARGAIKILHAEIAVDAGVRQRFLREGYAANTVAHRGVVKVLDDDVLEDGSVFLVMELLEGESLESRRMRAGGRLPAPEVLSAADQLLDVLMAAHAKGIVHRDIKPDNVFVTTDGQVKVLDFGIAKLKQSAGTGKATKTGSAMGTPAYMPPEQARGRWEIVDARSDIWAVGATMYSLLTGRLVHEADTVNEQLLAAMTLPAPSVGVGENFAPALVAVVDRAVAFDPAQRWQDAASMQEAVREAYHAIFRSPITTAPKLSSPPPKPDVYGKTMPAPLATTGGAVAAGQTGVELARAASTPRWVWGAVGGIAAVVAASVVAVALLIRGPGPQAPAASSASQPEASVQTAASSAPAASSEPASSTAIDLDALPSATAPAGSGKARGPTVQPKAGPNTGKPVAPPAAKTPGPPAEDLMEKRR